MSGTVVRRTRICYALISVYTFIFRMAYIHQKGSTFLIKWSKWKELCCMSNETHKNHQKFETNCTMMRKLLHSFDIHATNKQKCGSRSQLFIMCGVFFSLSILHAHTHQIFNVISVFDTTRGSKPFETLQKTMQSHKNYYFCIFLDFWEIC